MNLYVSDSRTNRTTTNPCKKWKVCFTSIVVFRKFSKSVWRHVHLYSLYMSKLVSSCLQACNRIRYIFTEIVLELILLLLFSLEDNSYRLLKWGIDTKWLIVRFQVASGQRVQYEAGIFTEKLREKFILQSNLLSSWCDNSLCSAINDRMKKKLARKDRIW